MAIKSKRGATDSGTRRVSYSQFAKYQNCPLQWKLDYVDNLAPDEASIHLVFGSAMHETIQEWLQKAYGSSFESANKTDWASVLETHMKRIFAESTIIDDKGVKIFPSDIETLVEFYQDGAAILNHVQQKYGKDIFQLEGFELLGVEIPLEVKLNDGVDFIGYIDVVMRNPYTNEIEILDLKTSTRGWNDYQKKDESKLSQLLLYKQFYSEKFGVPQDKINVHFIILKRKINENSDWEQRRVVKFSPACGKISVSKTVKNFNVFVNECFTTDGDYKIDHIKATPSKSACKYCYFATRPDLCKESYK